MKNKILISLLITVTLIMGCFTVPVYAVEEQIHSDSSIEYFDDGSYMIMTITESTIGRATIKSGTKTITYKDSDDETQWTYKVTGTFSYTGSSATCTAVSDSYTISNDNWHMSSHSCSKSSNTANGSVTMKHKVLGITIKTVSQDITLTCSATGVLS